MISIPWTTELLAHDTPLGGVKVRLLVITPIDLDPDGHGGEIGGSAGVVVDVASLRGASAVLAFIQSENIAGRSGGKSEADDEHR